MYPCRRVRERMTASKLYECLYTSDDADGSVGKRRSRSRRRHSRAPRPVFYYYYYYSYVMNNDNYHNIILLLCTDSAFFLFCRINPFSTFTPLLLSRSYGDYTYPNPDRGGNYNKIYRPEKKVIFFFFF